MTIQSASLLDHRGIVLGEMAIHEEQDGWFTGVLTDDRLSSDARAAIDWYDEVVQNQMLSYLDQALAAVAKLDLKVRFSNEEPHQVYSLDITPEKEVSFRITPVPRAT
jgi:hypothetical protein